ncbi:hypothetical protein CYMTET_18100, partial [Cymbomonas tetramitiformis]
MLLSTRLLQLCQPQRFLPLHLGRTLPSFHGYCSGTESREDTATPQDDASAAVESPVPKIVQDRPEGEEREKFTITRAEKKPNTRNILRITFAPRHAILEDVLNLLKGAGTQREDIRLGYDEKSFPTNWFVKFPTQAASVHVMKELNPAFLGSRPVRLSLTTQDDWDSCNQNFPQPALAPGCSTRVSGLTDTTRIE